MTQYLTKERHEELKKQLEELKNGGREEVAARLRHAKSFGDLSENSDYQEARDAQAALERRIRELEELIRTSRIIVHGAESKDEVRVGSKVTLRKDGKEIVYTIVGSNEANPLLGLISNESPIGRALLGKTDGKTAEAQTPRGMMKYEIIRIE
ncbi:MAG: transcription elongation factor GreA [Nanoarchaeota archaeon]|nr:transcription elongation factor GreA [Nanoarchaeota archaeon]